MYRDRKDDLADLYAEQGWDAEVEEQRPPGVAPGKLPRTVTAYGGRPTSRIPTQRLGAVMRRLAGSGAAPSSDAADAVDRASGSSGRPMPDGLRAELEGALGADLSGVRVHTGATSANASAQLGAKAFARGGDIHFASGSYDPDSDEGRHLIAHEAAHTVQQSGTPAGPQAKLELTQPGDALEAEADAFADAFVAGERRPVTQRATGRIARKEDDDAEAYMRRLEQQLGTGTDDPGARAAMPRLHAKVTGGLAGLDAFEQVLVPLCEAARDRLAPSALEATSDQLRAVGLAANRDIVEARGELEANALLRAQARDLHQRVLQADRQRARVTAAVIPRLGLHAFRGAPVPALPPIVTGNFDRDLRAALDGAPAAVRAAHLLSSRADAADLRSAIATLSIRQSLFVRHVAEAEGLTSELRRATQAGSTPASNLFEPLLQATGVGPAAAELLASRVPTRLVDDVVLSIDRSAKHIQALLADEWEAIADSWWIAAGFMTAEVVAVAMSASGHPYLQIPGIILQAILFALAVQGLIASIDEIARAAGAARRWYLAIRDADGNPEAIEEAARNFAVVAVAVIKGILAAIPAFRWRRHRRGQVDAQGGKAGKHGPNARIVRDDGTGKRRDRSGHDERTTAEGESRRADQANDEAIRPDGSVDSEDSHGNRRGTDADPDRHQPPRSRDDRLRELEIDPDNGKRRRAEAEAALGLEELGVLPPVVRRPVRGEGHGGADFVDGANQGWDVKAPMSRTTLEKKIEQDATRKGRPPPNLSPDRKIAGEFDLATELKAIKRELATGSNVILDSRGLSAEDARALRNAVDEAGLAQKVKWFPP